MISLQRFHHIGKCIYCGEAQGPFTDEHVIPFSLKGEMILRDASCKKCQVITSSCERNPIHENWIEARACLDYPSRRTNFDEKVFPMRVLLKNGTETVLNLTRDETLGIAQFPVFPSPAFLSPAGYKSGSVWCGLITIGFGKVSLAEFIKKYNVKEIKGSTQYKGNNFERMITRIAYCAVVAYLGPDCLVQNFILPAILGQKDDVGYWLGCDPLGVIVLPIGKVEEANAIKLGVLKRPDGSCYLLVSIKFFAASDAPEYMVVVGEPTKETLEELGGDKQAQ